MRVYFSHAMRGKAGDGASDEIQLTNNEVALLLAKKLRKRLPGIEVYVPAESEPFVRAAFDAKYLTIVQILELDCKVIDGCDIVICYVPEGDELQGGRLVEFDHAIDTLKPVMCYSDLDAAVEFIVEHMEYGEGLGGISFGRNADE
jgi:nucleoside 2-deoxyribosyltransferase